MQEENQLIIFDFDGVLVDTERTTFNFYREILPQYGIPLKEEDFRLKAGRKSVDFFKLVMKEKFNEELVQQVIKKKRAAFLADIKRYLIPIPGTLELIQELHKAGLLLAIGSQNERELLDEAVRVFNLAPYFITTRSLQEIKHKKPDPEIFISISEELGISPKRGVVIEDAIEGIEAAVTGGFKAVGVLTSYKPEDLHKADIQVKTPAELTVQQLKRI